MGPLLAWALEYFMKEIRYENLILDSDTLPGWFMALVYFFLLLKVFVLFEDPPPAASSRGQQGISSLPLRAFLTCLWIICAATICNSLLEVYLAKVAEEDWQWNVRYTSLYVASVSACLTPLCLIAGRLTQLVQDRKGLMILAPVGIVFSFLLMDFGLGVAGQIATLSVGAMFLLAVATLLKPLVMSVVTKIVPPHLKGISSTFTMASLCLGRGIGAICGSVMEPWSAALTHVWLFASMAILTAASYSHLKVLDMAD